MVNLNIKVKKTRIKSWSYIIQQHYHALFLPKATKKLEKKRCKKNTHL